MANTILSLINRLRAVIVLACLLPALLVLCATRPASALQDKVYTIAVLPSAPPVTLNMQWTPFVERLTRESGLRFHLKHYDRMAEFERDIWSGAPDFIFASPIQTVVAHKAKGYVPLVRGGKEIAIGLFVRKDSPYKTLNDLTGKSISFVGNKNVCSVFVQHMLGQPGVHLSFTREYAGSTRNVIINVLLGKSAAGAVFLPELAREPEDTRQQLRAIMVTPEIAPHPLSAHPRVPLKVQKAVTRATLAIADTPAGAQILETLRLGAPVAADYNRDYRMLEEIDIMGLTNWGQ